MAQGVVVLDGAVKAGELAVDKFAAVLDLAGEKVRGADDFVADLARVQRRGLASPDIRAAAVEGMGDSVFGTKTPWVWNRYTGVCGSAWARCAASSAAESAKRFFTYTEKLPGLKRASGTVEPPYRIALALISCSVRAVFSSGSKAMPERK